MKHLFLKLILLFACNSIDAQQYFTDCHVQGSTAIYDYHNKQWIFTDSTDARKGTLPASTFKIFNTLISLETKAVKDEHEIIKWDGTDKKLFGKKIDAWNSDTDLKTAYKNSTIWVYVEMAKKIGRPKYRHYLNLANYGNKNLSQKGVDFWNYGDFEVSPKEQVELLIKLYENKLPFSQTNMDKVKEMMVSEKNDSLIYRDKTGWTRKHGKDIGWYVGYVEYYGKPYFFATRITQNVYPENKDFAKCRISITKDILKKYLRE